MTHIETIREVSNWLQAEKIKKYDNEPITQQQDKKVRVAVYNLITNHYYRRMSRQDFGRFRRIAERALFTDAEINQK